MGVYDSVGVPCPECGQKTWFQTKSGPCEMNNYTLKNVPDDVFEDINRHSPCLCGCGTWFEVDEEIRRPVACEPRERRNHIAEVMGQDNWDRMTGRLGDRGTGEKTKEEKEDAHLQEFKKNVDRSIKVLMLKDFINWRDIMAAPWYAGGHDEVMDVLFEDKWHTPAKVIAKYKEDCYDGELAYAYMFQEKFKGIVVITDYFGSCSGCDEWERYEKKRPEDCVAIGRLLVEMANNARRFDTIDEAIVFCLSEKKAEDYGHRAAGNLTDQLMTWKKENQDAP